MDIEFQTYVPMPCTPGNTTKIGTTDWVCIKPCTLFGYTLGEGLPVIEGPDGAPALSDHHFLQARYFKTLPKGGQTYLEIMALRVYTKIDPGELVGKDVRYCRHTYDKVLVICTDNSYFKLVGEREQYDDDVFLREQDLTIQDLRVIGAISDEDFAAYEAERKAIREKDQEDEKIRRFRMAAKQIGLGVEKVKELLRDV